MVTVDLGSYGARVKPWKWH